MNGPKAWDLDLTVDITFLDTATNYRLTLCNGVLVYRRRRRSHCASDGPARRQAALLGLAAGDNSSPGLDISGNAGALQSLIGALDRPDPSFDIVTP